MYMFSKNLEASLGPAEAELGAVAKADQHITCVLQPETLLQGAGLPKMDQLDHVLQTWLNLPLQTWLILALQTWLSLPLQTMLNLPLQTWLNLLL